MEIINSMAKKDGKSSCKNCFK